MFALLATAAAAMSGTGRRFEPQPETQAVYDRLFRDVYQPLFPTVQPLVDRLTALTHGDDL